jgi:hypothetical protein
VDNLTGAVEKAQDVARGAVRSLEEARGERDALAARLVAVEADAVQARAKQEARHAAELEGIDDKV